MTPESLRDLFVLSPVGLLECEADGRVGVANLAARRLLAPFAGPTGLDDLFAVLARVDAALEAELRGYDGPRGVIVDGRDVVAPDGQAAVTLTVLRVASGGLVAIVVDARAALDARGAAARLAQRLRAADVALREHALVLLDVEGRIAEWSASAERIFQWRGSDAVGRPFAELLPPGEARDAAAQAMLARAARTGWCEDSALRARRDGTVFRATTVVAALVEKDRGPWGFEVVVQDQSERQRFDDAEAQTEEAVDAATGVTARRAFYEVSAVEVSRAKRYGHPLTLLLVDPDRAAEWRSAHGEAFVNEWLRAIADICRQESRTTDIVGRVGGEAIGVLLPSTEGAGGLVLAERIRERMQRHVFGGAHQAVRATVCVGVAEVGDAVDTADALVTAAATAVERAQQAGRNLVVGYDP